jgi:hypothetical protein
VRRLAASVYGRYYDMASDSCYWVDARSGEASWVASDWLRRQTIPLSPEDAVLFAAKQQIRELERQLQSREEEIRAVRQERHEEVA